MLKRSDGMLCSGGEARAISSPELASMSSVP